ncbi:MAG TPA: Holliday junction resolvase RuvX [Candidatus Ornithoclostridium excrementipullorum]|nr:Holliday junction resolvase RuvX [Candidatus Ornithoclostridium excrementipullorum]
MRHIGLDLGDARIGIATCGESEMFASPAETYRCRGREADLKYIAEYCAAAGAKRIVIGLPVNMDGTNGPRAEKVMAFGDALAELTDAEIVYQDERLTTVTGEQMLIGAGVRREKRKQVIDKIAAAIILQTYLDTEHGKTKKSR